MWPPWWPTATAGGCSSVGSCATRGTPATTWVGGWQRSSWCASRRPGQCRWLPRSGSPPSPCGAGARSLTPPGAQGLAKDKRGPKEPSRLTPEVVADIASRRRGGASLRAIAAAVGVSTFSVRRALPEPTPEPATPTEQPQPGPQADLPVLPPPAERDAERAAARWGKLTHAEPVFTPAARVPP